VAFGLTWALVDSVNSSQTVEARAGIRYCRFSSPAWLTACRENRKPEAPWQRLSYSVKDIDGHVVAVSYRGQEKKIAIAGGTPVFSTGHANAGPPGLPAERNADGALAVGFVVADASPRRWRPTATARAQVRRSTRSETDGSIAQSTPKANIFPGSGNIPSLPRVYNLGA
jgi:hypothetical protein